MTGGSVILTGNAEQAAISPRRVRFFGDCVLPDMLWNESSERLGVYELRSGIAISSRTVKLFSETVFSWICFGDCVLLDTWRLCLLDML